MNNSNALITQLFTIRNRYGKQAAHSALWASEKMQLLNSINIKTVKNKTAAASLYAALLFLIAYPDNKTIYASANKLLKELEAHIQSHEKLSYSLYNTGITGTTVCAAFSFEMVKWLRKTWPTEIKFNSFEAEDSQIQSMLSVVMTKTESEIFQDENAEWKDWLKQLKKPGEDLLDQFIAIFDRSDIRPEVKDELWNAIGINVEINFTSHCCLPASLTKIYYHRSLIRKPIKQHAIQKIIHVKLTPDEAEQVIDCSRMILLRNLRELDPISFSDVKLVNYYQLQRGVSIALMGLVPDRRHPIDCYMGYVVFKNGLPVSYAGSWIMFDSARISLNVFPDYRGGEAKYIFDQAMQLHTKLYRLKRFTVDPYQVGKENSDAINSGAFWIYYHAGFRPLEKLQRDLAEAEEIKIRSNKKYRSPAAVLKTLANSRLELVLQKTAVRFDATDLSRLYAGILTKKYKGDRQRLEKDAVKKLAGILGLKNYHDENMKFVLKNWGVLLLNNEKELQSNSALKRSVKELVSLKAGGSEEAYITVLQKATRLRSFIDTLLKRYVG